MKKILLIVILTTGCGATHRKKIPPPSIPRNVEMEFEKLEKLKVFKRQRRERWKRWHRTIRPRPPKNLSGRKRKQANTSRLKIEIDQNIEWYCIKQRKNLQQCRRHTQPILNRCTRKNGNNLNRKVLNCIKKRLRR